MSQISVVIQMPLDGNLHVCQLLMKYALYEQVM